MQDVIEFFPPVIHFRHPCVGSFSRRYIEQSLEVRHNLLGFKDILLLLSFTPCILLDKELNDNNTIILTMIIIMIILLIMAIIIIKLLHVLLIRIILQLIIIKMLLITSINDSPGEQKQ